MCRKRDFGKTLFFNVFIEKRKNFKFFMIKPEKTGKYNKTLLIYFVNETADIISKLFSREFINYELLIKKN